MPVGLHGRPPVPWTHEHQEEADRVRAVSTHQGIRVLDIASRLAHPLAVGSQDLALVEQALERFPMVDQPAVGHRLGEEAAVEQVHHGMLGPAGVLIDRRPSVGHRAVDGPVPVVGDR